MSTLTPIPPRKPLAPPQVPGAMCQPEVPTGANTRVPSPTQPHPPAHGILLGSVVDRPKAKSLRIEKRRWQFKEGRLSLPAGRVAPTSRTRIIGYPFGRDAASSVPQPAGCQDYQAGRIPSPGAVSGGLLPSGCARGLRESHQCYLTNANPPVACGPTPSECMMRTAPRVLTSPAVRACRYTNRNID